MWEASRRRKEQEIQLENLSPVKTLEFQFTSTTRHMTGRREGFEFEIHADSMRLFFEGSSTSKAIELGTIGLEF